MVQLTPAVAGSGSDQITSTIIVEMRYRSACLEKTSPRISALEQMFDTFAATTNSFLNRLNGQIALSMDRIEVVAESSVSSPDFAAILNDFYKTENAVPTSFSVINDRLFNLEVINDRREQLEIPDTSGLEQVLIDYDRHFDRLLEFRNGWQVTYETLVENIGHLDARLAIIELSSLRWNAIIPASAGEGLFDIETRLTILEQPPENLGQSSQETRIVLLEASATAATAAVCATRMLNQDRFLDIEERIAEIYEVIKSPLVEESFGVDETVPTHGSSPPVPLTLSHSFPRGAASFQTICKNNDAQKKLSVFSVPICVGL